MKSIALVGEKRRLLSDIFNARNAVVHALDDDDPASYSSCVRRLKQLAEELEDA